MSAFIQEGCFTCFYTEVVKVVSWWTHRELILWFTFLRQTKSTGRFIVQRVAFIGEDMWLRQTTVPPYLKDSPAALMLLGYYPDGVGISATDPIMHTKKSKPTGECVCVSGVLSACPVCSCGVRASIADDVLSCIPQNPNLLVSVSVCQVSCLLVQFVLLGSSSFHVGTSITDNVLSCDPKNPILLVSVSVR